MKTIYVKCPDEYGLKDEDKDEYECKHERKDDEMGGETYE
jgi:hypothetical protein